MLLALLTLAVLEVLLRLFHHQLLPQAISNEVANPYYIGLGGLYVWDADIKFTSFKPGYRRDMYFSGYRWHHQGDRTGFRNPIDRDHADVVLVGDSMIYGHGVEEEDTVRHRLEDLLRRPVANLGMQAAASHSEYQLVKRYAVRLRPRHVLVFFLVNDIEDLTVYLTDDEMRRFLAAPKEQRDVRYFERYEETWHDRIAGIGRGFYSLRAISIAAEFLKRAASGEAHAGEYGALPQPASFRREPRLGLAMAFHLYAVKRMALVANDHGAGFAHVFLYTGQPDRHADEAFYEAVLARWCGAEGIPFLSLREPLAAALAAGEEPFLPGDGHLSPRGAALVAAEVARWIGEREAETGAAGLRVEATAP